jgi:predicted HAD superfamily phosphohydrolase
VTPEEVAVEVAALEAGLDETDVLELGERVARLVPSTRSSRLKLLRRHFGEMVCVDDYESIAARVSTMDLEVLVTDRVAEALRGGAE